ncbi:adenylate cyclase [Ectobacillus funiculus]|uniref:F390 synthetase-related protein n=1 Tax=Ectobacillus funiculus TaxID=137993 RepID=UPI00397A8D99
MNNLKILQKYIETKYRTGLKTEEQLRNFQNARITKHMQFVLQHSVFYKNMYQPYMNEVSSQQWEQLPIIDKKIMMEHFDSLNTAGITKEQAFQVAFEAERTRNFSPTIHNITIGLSSGTSGNRGLFLVSEEERYLWAGSILAKVLPSSILKKQKIAFFLRANSNLYETTKNKRISFHFFDLLDYFETHIKRLNEIRPTIVIAPPSMLRKIAEWKEEGHIHIAPKKVISVAEVLEDLDKEYMQSVFGQVVHQIYQCTEGFLATTCKQGTLHMNEDLVYIDKEYVDKGRGIFIPIITDFSRKTQPIIRYRLNDLLIEKKQPCSCGSPFLALERIDGRCDDVFIGRGKTTTKEISLFPDFIRRAVMLAAVDIEEFKVIQHPNLFIEVKLKIKRDENRSSIENAVGKELYRLWRDAGCERPTIFYSEYDILPSEKKLKRIERILS